MGEGKESDLFTFNLTDPSVTRTSLSLHKEIDHVLDISAGLFSGRNSLDISAGPSRLDLGGLRPSADFEHLEFQPHVTPPSSFFELPNIEERQGIVSSFGRKSVDGDSYGLFDADLDLLRSQLKKKS